MTKTDYISASILSADFTRLGAEIREAEAAGVDWIHLDVMDGHFVPNLTMGPLVVAACRRVTDLPLDVHLMIEQPERLLPAFADAGANYLTVHVETCPHLYRTLQLIRDLGCRPGVTLNPGTVAIQIKPVLPLVDQVLVMTVNPGFSGQNFLPGMVEKIEQVGAWLDKVNPDALLAVDGGINATTAPAAKTAGAQVFVAASAIFQHPEGITAGVQALRAKITQPLKRKSAAPGPRS